MKKNIAIIIEPGANQRGKKLAKKLQLPITAPDADYEFFLRVDTDKLSLQENNTRKKPIIIDFLTGSLQHRRKYGGGQGQLIAKAVGIKPGNHPNVIDATAGLGRDAFVLASLGCQVTMLERSPIIAELLKDGLKRARKNDEFSEINLKLIETDAIDFLQTHAKCADVIYLDPMFPTRTKSAKVKKEMHALQTLIGKDADIEKLLEAALEAAKKRVVVKRPKLAESIPGPKPDLIYRGKSTRFDVYLITSKMVNRS